MGETLRIGLPLIAGPDWLGGVNYLVNLVRAVRLAADQRPVEIYFVANATNVGHLPLYQEALPLVDGVVTMSGVERLPEGAPPAIACDGVAGLFEVIDFFYPSAYTRVRGHPMASWIADFQHIHHPELFSRQERERRDACYADYARGARFVVLSSEDARADFVRAFPDAAARPLVLHFHAAPDPSWLLADPRAVQREYGLPDQFLICCNQFWTHKNHETLFEALHRLRERHGRAPHLVCTGATHDYRCGDHFERLSMLLERRGLSDQVHILGAIPRDRQVALLRRSMAVVQPSLFEGWSSIVEEARCFAKRVFLSDIGVHREQLGGEALFFPPRDVDALVRLFDAHLDGLSAGPQAAAEARALSRVEDRVRGFGERFLDLAATSVDECRT